MTISIRSTKFPILLIAASLNLLSSCSSSKPNNGGGEETSMFGETMSSARKGFAKSENQLRSEEGRRHAERDELATANTVIGRFGIMSSEDAQSLLIDPYAVNSVNAERDFAEDTRLPKWFCVGLDKARQIRMALLVQKYARYQVLYRRSASGSITRFSMENAANFGWTVPNSGNETTTAMYEAKMYIQPDLEGRPIELKLGIDSTESSSSIDGTNMTFLTFDCKAGPSTTAISSTGQTDDAQYEGLTGRASTDD